MVWVKEAVLVIESGPLSRLSKLDSGASNECTLTDVPRINATAACLLGLLQLGPAPGQLGYAERDAPMTGSQLWRAAATSIARFWNLTRSQVFRELPALHAQGLVEAAEVGPRRSRPFRITNAGRRAFAQWLADFISAQPREEQLHSPLVLMVFFAEFAAPDALRNALLGLRQQHAQRLAALLAMQQVLGDSTRLPAHTVGRGTAYQRLTIDWIDAVLRDMPVAETTNEPPVRRSQRRRE